MATVPPQAVEGVRSTDGEAVGGSQEGVASSGRLRKEAVGSGEVQDAAVESQDI
jgi:predicted secreted protein